MRESLFISAGNFFPSQFTVGASRGRGHVQRLQQISELRPRPSAVDSRRSFPPSHAFLHRRAQARKYFSLRHDVLYSVAPRPARPGLRENARP